VLSRVTLGADVAVTSVLLDAAKRRYPNAEIVFVGPLKSYELFEADARIKHQPAPYARSGALQDRLRASANLWIDDGIVIDPDSRLSQLGLLSVCDDHKYFHFPSRAYGGAGEEPLAKLAARWAQKVFGVEGARPFIAPQRSAEPPADITVSLGVGENASKRLDDAQERELLRTLAQTGASLLVDKGGSAEERERVERALLPGMRTHDGAFAPYAAQIAASKLFVGYDSAGGHVASACGVPLISIAKGFVTERMAARWRPNGTVLKESDLAQVPELARRILNT
jgi:ADP-heptose:LPS heptosyltransferase